MVTTNPRGGLAMCFPLLLSVDVVVASKKHLSFEILGLLIFLSGDKE